MLELLYSPEAWISFVTLAVLEIVLGVDNLLFISILAGKLPEEQRAKARQIGLAVALITRLLLLVTLAWAAKLTTPIATLDFGFEHPFVLSWRSIILGLGGMYLIYKAVVEMNEIVRARHHGTHAAHGTKKDQRPAVFGWIILQIAIIDIVFSLDSVITAVGMVNEVPIMAAAIIVAVLVMLFLINPIATFIDKHPEVKIVALSFLLLVGFILVADAGGIHIPKPYLYFALGFSTFVQIMILWAQGDLGSDSKTPSEQKEAGS
ncbi:MAG TPA: hypothetical protein DCL54_15100 [Alphaproteobacteria bacterium]|nr:hypothetical protein [Alphaproteobacteria bacterium]